MVTATASIGFPHLFQLPALPALLTDGSGNPFAVETPERQLIIFLTRLDKAATIITLMLDPSLYS